MQLCVVTNIQPSEEVFQTVEWVLETIDGPNLFVALTKNLKRRLYMRFFAILPFQWLNSQRLKWSLLEKNMGWKEL
jgi:hypothetical protein